MNGRMGIETIMMVEVVNMIGLASNTGSILVLKTLIIVMKNTTYGPSLPFHQTNNIEGSSDNFKSKFKTTHKT